MNPEQHIPTTEAIKAIKEIGSLVRRLNKTTTLAKKVKKAQKEGRITAERSAELTATLRSQAQMIATEMAQCAFYIGQGDDSDRELLGESIAAVLVK